MIESFTWRGIDLAKVNSANSIRYEGRKGSIVASVERTNQDQYWLASVSLHGMSWTGTGTDKEDPTGALKDVDAKIDVVRDFLIGDANG